ncbi:two-partner secretion domain-containing protein, partial [Kaarinaea lacus]
MKRNSIRKIRYQQLSHSCYILLFIAAIPLTSLASPQGGQVVRGDGNIQQPNAQSTVVNQNSHSMVVNWKSFNVDAGENVQFVQPSASASVLNRIMDQNPSQIFGTIDANGRVFLINTNGIVFGESSSVNVGSLVASGLNIDPDAFMNGDYRFSAEEGKEGGMVVNRGVIQAATGGSVNLIGGAVRNEGLIVAQVGQINMGAGRSVVLDFDGDGLMRFEVDGELISNTSQLAVAVSNNGVLSADGGEIMLSAKAARNVFDQVINNEGVIKATKIERKGGVVRLVGEGGEVQHSGLIDASGYSTGEIGGDVEILGDQVRLASGSIVDASGANGGGNVLIGGEYRGQGTSKTANSTYVSNDSRINADALNEGDGGEVILWANNDTEFHGSISARGGQQFGNGGFVEISGKNEVTISNYVNLSASKGRAGTLLIDPGTIHVCDDASCGSQTGPNTFSDDYISTQLGSANMILDTSAAGVSGSNGNDQDINFLDPTIDITWNTNTSLTLDAGRDVTLMGSVNDNGSGGTLTINSGQLDGGSIVSIGDTTLNVSNISINGGLGSDTLVGSNGINNWNITADNTGNINNIVNFTSMENLTGGSVDDAFNFSDGTAVSGSVDGGSGGADTLNYSNYSTAVIVDLGNNTATATGGISNI